MLDRVPSLAPLTTLTAILSVTPGCMSTQRTAHPVLEPPLVAALGPVVPPAAPVFSEPSEPSAGTFLEQGFLHYHEGRMGEAQESFSAAIATGDLNLAGRALAYWHIAEAHRAMADEDRMAEAMFSFTSVAQDIIDTRHVQRFVEEEQGDFVDFFDLERRISLARGTLAAAWARRMPYYGRSPDFPVVTHGLLERDYFVELALPCGDAPDRLVYSEVLCAKDGKPISPNLERVTVWCTSRAQGEQYFITYKGEEPTTQPCSPENEPSSRANE